MIDYIKSQKARQDLKKFLKGKVDKEQLEKLQYHNLESVNKLYKYSSINEYTGSNISNNYLIAKRPESFNDIFDSTMHSNTYIKNKQELEKSINLSKQFGYEKAYEGFDDDYIRKFSTDQDRHRMTYFRRDLYINCLTDTNSNILMWSHYADNNSGICIEYDFSNADNDISAFTYPVIYIDEPIDVTELIKGTKDIPLAILISAICKYKDWKYENEWRIIFYFPFSGSNDRTKGIAELIAPNISTIYLGNSFVDHYNRISKRDSSQLSHYRSFFDIVKRNSIIIKVAKLQVKSYKLEFEQFDIGGLA
jgi:hypothetical protein